MFTRRKIRMRSRPNQPRVNTLTKARRPTRLQSATSRSGATTHQCITLQPRSRNSSQGRRPAAVRSASNRSTTTTLSEIACGLTQPKHTTAGPRTRSKSLQLTQSRSFIRPSARTRCPPCRCRRRSRQASTRGRGPDCPVPNAFPTQP